jgi:GTPase SAR1 family protein
VAITTTHYRFAVGAFLVYDVTNINSFISLQEWLDRIREFSDPSVVIALVANKVDLVDEDDRLNNYGKYSNYGATVLDTEEDNENSQKSKSKMQERGPRY